MNIVYLVFGDGLAYHLQTYFSILTALKARREGDTITVYTDYPQYYRRLSRHVCIREITAKEESEWLNGTGYVFRAKIKAIEDAMGKHPDKHLLFLDGDTVVRDGFHHIELLLDKGTCVMHADEGHPSKMRGASLRMWKAIEGETLGSCTFSMRHNVWNSGVIGIPASKLGEVVPMALTVCDFILGKQVRCFTAEQYAFSVAIQEAGAVKPAKDWVAHYWGNKDGWHELIGEFMLSSYMQGRSVEEDIKALDDFPLSTTPTYVHHSSTKRRLVGLLDKLFKDKPFPGDNEKK